MIGRNSASNDAQGLALGYRAFTYTTRGSDIDEQIP
jgi:hypothetical protein